MQNICTVQSLCDVIVHMCSQHAYTMTGQNLNVDGGKNLTVRGLQTWLGLNRNQKRGLELNQSAGIKDLTVSKLQQLTNKHGQFVKKQDVEETVKENLVSQWGANDLSAQQPFLYYNVESAYKEESRYCLIFTSLKTSSF